MKQARETRRRYVLGEPARAGRLTGTTNRPRKQPTPGATPRTALVQNLGLCLLLLAIVGSWLVQSPPDSPYRPAQLLQAVATVVLAAVTLFRPKARHADTRWWVYALCLLSIAYPNAYRFNSASGSLLPVVLWGRPLLQFCASAALLGLGRSYAMLPALRQVRTDYLYAVVRHPVYALYLLADLGTVALQPSLGNAAVALVGGSMLVLRARLEEKVLCRDPAYAGYMRVVRWRFVPGLF
jgi:hypothetical protein